MQAKITKKLVDQMQPGPTDILVFDTLLKGFILKVTPLGAKTYLVRYRMGGRATPLRKYTIGRHGSPWTPDSARTEAEKLLAKVRQGTDPAVEKKERLAQGFTVTELADRYLSQHVDMKNKATTQKEFRRLVETIIKPELGTRATASITRGDISALHHRLRATPRQANHVLSVLSKMFSLSEVWGFRPDNTNPCRLIERYRETARERFLSDDEVVEVGKAVAAAEHDRTAHDSVLNAIRLLLLTGCRVGELLALRWTDIDLEAALLLIRDAKAGARAHPIGAVAVAFLTEMGRTSPWVLPGIQDANKPLAANSLSHTWGRIRTKAKLEDVRLHDLRHTVGTYAGQTGANAFLVRDKLGHKTLNRAGIVGGFHS
ncbi:MAG: site-specific integrase [Azospirillaceae bacterium]|nr:site-specific integrase [Azospirillaceae bacterium]